MTKKFIAKGEFVRYFGKNTSPHTVGFEVHDSEGKLFEKEEVLMSNDVFLKHLMKAFNCTLAPHLRDIRVTMIFEQ